jgi:hypothetical protein
LGDFGATGERIPEARIGDLAGPLPPQRSVGKDGCLSAARVPSLQRSEEAQGRKMSSSRRDRVATWREGLAFAGSRARIAIAEWRLDVGIAMVVGMGLVELRIPGCGSLKEKRSVLKAILRRTQNEFNCSIAEVGDNDLWQKAAVGFAAVGNDRPAINAKLDHILRFIEGLDLAVAVRSRIEIISCGELLEGPAIEEDKFG